MARTSQIISGFGIRHPPEDDVSSPPSHGSIVLGSSIPTEPTTRSTSYGTETNKTSVAPSRDSADSQQAMLNAKSNAAESSSAAPGSRIRPAGFTAINDASNTRRHATQTSTSNLDYDQATSRNVSGTSTLVNEIDEPEQRLLHDSVNALDLEWEMPNNEPEPTEAKQDTTRRRSTRAKLISKASSGKSKVVSAASNLGKRTRDAFEEGEVMKDKPKSSPKKKRKSVKHPKEDEPVLQERLTVSERATIAIYGMAGIAVDVTQRKGIVPRPPEAGRSVVEAEGASETTRPNEETLQQKPGQTKKWLSSGLYRGQTSSSDPKLSPAKNDQKHASGTGKTKEGTMMPLPMFAGEALLQKGRPFKLPFDVFSPLPPGQPKPDEWRKFQTNRFIGDAAIEWKKSKLLPMSRCCCTIEDGCDDDCQNRYMLYECDDDNCSVGAEHCTNRAFATLKERCRSGNKYDIGVEVMKTDEKGFGVRSCRTFEPNQIIVEYAGEIITQEECDRRVMNEYKNVDCYYLMSFDQNMIIDATRGSIARFVNHSCEPNCRMIKWNVSGRPRMALFAGDGGIMTGEELTYDYNFDPFKREKVQECKCGAPSCRGFLGPKPSKDKEKERASLASKAKLAAKSTTQKVAGVAAGAKRKIDDFFGPENPSRSPSKKARTTNNVTNIDDGQDDSTSDDELGPIKLVTADEEPNPTARIVKASEQARLAGKAKPNKKEQEQTTRFTFTHQQAVANYNDAVRSLTRPKSSTPAREEQEEQEEQEPYETFGFAGSADTVVPSDRESEFDCPKVKHDIPSQDDEARKDSVMHRSGVRGWVDRVFEQKVASKFTIGQAKGGKAKARKAKEAREEEEKKKQKEKVELMKQKEEEERKKKQEEMERKKKEKKRPHWVWEWEVAEEERPRPGLSGGLTGSAVIVGASVKNPEGLDAEKENGERRGSRTLRQRTSTAPSTARPSSAKPPSTRHVSTATTIQRRSSSSIREEARKDLEASGELDNAGQATVPDSDDSSAPLNPRPVEKKKGLKQGGRVRVPEGISFLNRKRKAVDGDTGEDDSHGRSEKVKSVRLVD
ncbi:MAG: hypothetical protein M1831_006695 [Alyxoria varia]|nr:MAG: hypothetical protein M1831_006695 [Alyxoria varia]